ncbi:hypothetical protein [Rhodoglobus aureus]|uniref:Uncharacterized protein n=1 Tax=Rhodoglobus aureus TaxID=191497 RepID=A0ABN1VZD5_9MICO
MSRTYSARNLRKFDRNIFATGLPYADRVLETVPFCWMCPAVIGNRTREHVFARSLLREFPPELTIVSPIRYTSPALGSLVASSRGEFPASALVAGAVCATCNNGWMSQLEMDARPYLLDKVAAVEGAAITILARWLAKTAIVINISQPYRLLWSSDRRHQVQTRVPDNLAISLYRVPVPDLNWAQGASVSITVHHPDLDAVKIGNLSTNLTHLCRIQVGTLVGVVVAFPWQLAASTLLMPGQILWSRGTGFEVDLRALPSKDEPFGAPPQFDVVTNAFWAGN